MKTSYYLSRLRPMLSAMMRYWIAHAASQDAIKQTYRREWQEAGSAATRMAEISIFQRGSLYEVYRVFYTDGHFQREESWLASYGWHSSGRLIALGRSIYLVFDPISKLLYLEEWTGDEKQMETYYELNNDL